MDYEIPSSFEEQGFAVIKEVLSAQEVKELRNFALDKFKRYGNKRILYPGEEMNYPEFFQIYFRYKIVEAMKKLL